MTCVLPKELLPINGKPGLEYILEEGINAGIKEFIFIISNIRKKILKNIFIVIPSIKKLIKKKSKDKRLKLEFLKIKKYKKMIKFVYQNDTSWYW